MIRPNWKSLLIGIAVVALLVSFAPQADAFWGWRHAAYYGYGVPYSSCYTPCYSSCYTPCYSSCYTPCYSSCYTPSYSVGYSPYGYGYGYGYGYSWRRARRFYRASYLYSGCCNPCSTSLCCNVTGSMSPVVPTLAKPVEPAPAAPLEAPALPSSGVPAAAPLPTIEPLGPAAPAPGNTNAPTRADSGLLTIWVPYDAKVTVNGLPTKSNGSRRQFVSYGLKPGFSYKYIVRAEIVRNGQIVGDTKTVVLTAGDRTAVAFGFNALSTRSLAAK